PVRVQHRRADPAAADLRLGEVEPYERVGIERRPELARIDASGEVRGRRREDVASVERPRNRVEPVRGRRQLVCVHDPAEPLGRRHEKTVVRTDVEPAVEAADDDAPPGAADAGIDDGEVNADRHVGDGVRQHERSLEHTLRNDPVGDVDDVRLGRDPLDDAVAGADEVVLEPEVGQEGDEHEGRLTTEAIAVTSPSRSCVVASAAIRSPAALAARAVSGPITTAGTPSASAAKARAADGEARTATSPPGGTSGRSSTVR